jgi:hypothetical protein
MILIGSLQVRECVMNHERSRPAGGRTRLFVELHSPPIMVESWPTHTFTGKCDISSDEILRRLRIRPTDVRTAQAIRMQLENLEGYGLVKATPRGWRWIG